MVRLGFIILLRLLVIIGLLSSRYYLLRLIFLVCESSLGFMVFIMYSCFNFDLVKGVRIIEF